MSAARGPGEEIIARCRPGMATGAARLRASSRGQVIRRPLGEAAQHRQQRLPGRGQRVAEFFPDGRWKSVLVVNIGHPGPDPWFGRLPRLDHADAIKWA